MTINKLNIKALYFFIAKYIYIFEMYKHCIL